MPATLLVLDIDGTLRPHGEPRVPKENVDALRTVQKAGVKLVIATGRCRAEIPAKMLRGIRPDYWFDPPLRRAASRCLRRHRRP